MSDTTVSQSENETNMFLFWGCFIALITTAFGFITRIFLLSDKAFTDKYFVNDTAEIGEYIGIQIWPFAVSIIIFSLIIDKVGYKFSMMFAFACQFTWAVLGVFALSTIDASPERAKSLIYWGGLILALGNGTVEAFINPVVSTMFDKDKTKWLNILHAGWPGGLVIAGLLMIFMGELPWNIKLATIAIPAIVYFLMLIKVEFPKQERVAAGVSYKDMLSEFGVMGAAVVSFLVTLQLLASFSPNPEDNKVFFIGIGVAMVVAFGFYTKSLGRPLMFVLILIMMPLATTEIGTDAWITGIMENAVTFDPGWILVYTSFIMMVLRFFAGPIVHSLSSLGLLMLSCVLAIAGLWCLSLAEGVAIIFAAATLYALGKTFFWPTMLGVVAEQTPRGGALTLNAISGIGMLAVGTLGTPYIGALQAEKEIQAVKPLVVSVQEDQITESKTIYEIISYRVLDKDKVTELVVNKAPEAEQAKLQAEIDKASSGSGQKALASMTIFPLIMLLCYIAMWFYFKSKGGYKPVSLNDGH